MTMHSTKSIPIGLYRRIYASISTASKRELMPATVTSYAAALTMKQDERRNHKSRDESMAELYRESSVLEQRNEPL